MANFSFAGTVLWDIQTLFLIIILLWKGWREGVLQILIFICVLHSCLLSPIGPSSLWPWVSLFYGSFSDFQQLLGPHRESFPASGCLCVSFPFSYLHIPTAASDSPMWGWIIHLPSPNSSPLSESSSHLSPTLAINQVEFMVCRHLFPVETASRHLIEVMLLRLLKVLINYSSKRLRLAK